jgi:hypothetical protein
VRATAPLRRARLLRLASDPSRSRGNATRVAMSTDAAGRVMVERTCPRCGTESAGAPWCPKCGLNLRVKSDAGSGVASSAVPTPPASAPPTAPVRRHPSNAVLLAIVAVVVAIAGAAVGIVLATRGSSTNTTFAAPSTIVRTVPVVTPTIVSVTTPAPVEPEVSVADMHDVLDQYAEAYSSEDVGLLSSLFASDLVRQNGTDPPEDRSQALATYQRQFDGLTNPVYRLANLQYESGAGEGVAFGTYVIEHAAGTASGKINFHFVSSDGRLLIDGIVVTPSP